MSEEIKSGEYSRKWGLIFGLISALIFIATAALRLDLGAFLPTAIAWGVVIAVFVLGSKEFRTANGGYMSFGKGFGINFMIALIGGVVRSVIQYVYLMVDPEYLNYAKELRENNSFGPPPPEGQEMPAWAEFFNTAEFVIIASIIAAIFAGLIFGAIVAAILKNEEEDY